MSDVRIFRLGEITGSFQGVGQSVMFNRLPSTDMIVVWDGKVFKNIPLKAERFEVPFCNELPNLKELLFYSPDLTSVHLCTTTINIGYGIWIDI